jgi:hypothetical protein
VDHLEWLAINLPAKQILPRDNTLAAAWASEWLGGRCACCSWQYHGRHSFVALRLVLPCAHHPRTGPCMRSRSRVSCLAKFDVSLDGALHKHALIDSRSSDGWFECWLTSHRAKGKGDNLMISFGCGTASGYSCLSYVGGHCERFACLLYRPLDVCMQLSSSCIHLLVSSWPIKRQRDRQPLSDHASPLAS